jgi:N-methylhydantoinase B
MTFGRRSRGPGNHRGTRRDDARAARLPGEPRLLRQPGDRGAFRWARRGSGIDASKSDPVTLELVKNSLSSITDEMSVTLARTARSLGVKDARDFSVALCNSRGDLVTGGVGLAVHLGAIPAAMAAVLAAFPDGLDPGDVIVMNDPYSGGMHLPDMFVFKPIHAEGELLGIAAVVAHMADIGGRVPGGNAADSTEIYQEGLRVPPLKLYTRGQLNDSWLTLLAANVRQPATVQGDLFAEVAACSTANAHLGALALDWAPRPCACT